MKVYVKSADIVNGDIPVAKYSSTITYSGNYEDYTKEDFINMANDAGFEYEYCLYYPADVASKKNDIYTVTRLHGTNKCTVNHYIIVDTPPVRNGR